MKVAYVTMQFPVPSEAFAAVELRALHRLGAEISVLTFRSPPASAQELLDERGLAELTIDQGGIAASLVGLLQVFRRPGDSLSLTITILKNCWRRPRQLFKALALVPRSLALLRHLEVLKPDVLHLFWGHYPSLLGLLARRRLPQTTISLFLGAYDLEQALPLSALLAREADLVVTHAAANLPALAGFGLSPGQIEISYRGIEVPSSPPAPRKTAGLMVIAERLVPQKHTADALRIFARIAKAEPQAHLMVFGDGPEAGALHELSSELGIAKQVTFAGHVPQAEVHRNLAAAEAALTMSQSPSERLPNAIKEAMLQRCLCLSSRTTGIEELISDGETGLLVNFGDIDTAADKLLSTLRDREATDRIGRRAQAHIVEHFNVERLMAKRLERWAMLRHARLPDRAA